VTNADCHKCIRSLGELCGSKSEVCVEEISTIHNKSIGYRNKERGIYSGKFTSPVMGSSSPQTFGVLQNQQNIYKDDPFDIMRYR